MIEIGKFHYLDEETFLGQIFDLYNILEPNEYLLIYFSINNHIFIYRDNKVDFKEFSSYLLDQGMILQKKFLIFSKKMKSIEMKIFELIFFQA